MLASVLAAGELLAAPCARILRLVICSIGILALIFPRNKTACFLFRRCLFGMSVLATRNVALGGRKVDKVLATSAAQIRPLARMCADVHLQVT